MILGAAFVVILLAFLALKLFEGVLGFVFHGFGWIIAIALIYYWYSKDHAGGTAARLYPQMSYVLVSNVSNSKVA